MRLSYMYVCCMYIHAQMYIYKITFIKKVKLSYEGTLFSEIEVGLVPGNCKICYKAKNYWVFDFAFFFFFA